MPEIRVIGTPIRFIPDNDTVFGVEKMYDENAIIPGETWTHPDLGLLRVERCFVCPDTGDVTVVFCSSVCNSQKN